MSLFRLGLTVICFWPLLQRADSEYVRVTLRPGQYFTRLPFWQFTFKRSFEACSHMPPDRTEIGAFELTVPALVKTMTEVSLVTVTQLSMETTTVGGACSAAATTAVGIFFFSSRTHTLANPWYSAPCDCPSNVSAFTQPVGLASDTGSGGNSHGKLVFRRILDD